LKILITVANSQCNAVHRGIFKLNPSVLFKRTFEDVSILYGGGMYARLCTDAYVVLYSVMYFSSRGLSQTRRHTNRPMQRAYFE